MWWVLNTAFLQGVWNFCICQAEADEKLLSPVSNEHPQWTTLYNLSQLAAGELSVSCVVPLGEVLELQLVSPRLCPMCLFPLLTLSCILWLK